MQEAGKEAEASVDDLRSELASLEARMSGCRRCGVTCSSRSTSGTSRASTRDANGRSRTSDDDFISRIDSLRELLREHQALADQPFRVGGTRQAVSSGLDPPRLEHVRVNVSDYGRAVAWYEAILELTAEATEPPEAPSTPTSRPARRSSRSRSWTRAGRGATTSASVTWTPGWEKLAATVPTSWSRSSTRRTARASSP